MPKKHNKKDPQLKAFAQSLEKTPEQLAAEKEAQSLADAQALIAARFAKQREIVGHFAPLLPDDGVMSRIRHLSNLDPIGIAAESFVDILIFAFELLFNFPYLEDQKNYNAALKAEIGALSEGRRIQLVYRKDAHGNWPTIYKADPYTGEVDFNHPLTHDQVTNFDIRANGLRPQPSFDEGLLKACDNHIRRMEPSWITPEQKLRMDGFLEAADKRAHSKDLLSDRIAAGLNRPTPARK